MLSACENLFLVPWPFVLGFLGALYATAWLVAFIAVHYVRRRVAIVAVSLAITVALSCFWSSISTHLAWMWGMHFAAPLAATVLLPVMVIVDGASAWPGWAEFIRDLFDVLLCWCVPLTLIYLVATYHSKQVPELRELNCRKWMKISICAVLITSSLLALWLLEITVYPPATI